MKALGIQDETNKIVQSDEYKRADNIFQEYEQLVQSCANNFDHEVLTLCEKSL